SLMTGRLRSVATGSSFGGIRISLVGSILPAPRGSRHADPVTIVAVATYQRVTGGPVVLRSDHGTDRGTGERTRHHRRGGPVRGRARGRAAARLRTPRDGRRGADRDRCGVGRRPAPYARR